MLLQWAFLSKQWTQLAALHYCVVLQLRPDGKDNRRNTKPVLPAWRLWCYAFPESWLLGNQYFVVTKWCDSASPVPTVISVNTNTPRSQNTAAASLSTSQRSGPGCSCNSSASLWGCEWPKDLAEVLELRQCFPKLQDFPNGTSRRILCCQFLIAYASFGNYAPYDR